MCILHNYRAIAKQAGVGTINRALSDLISYVYEGFLRKFLWLYCNSSDGLDLELLNLKNHIFCKMGKRILEK